jgi:hypothetical protein
LIRLVRINPFDDLSNAAYVDDADSFGP